MVSLKTEIAGFSFDNCLMNAAGIYCMTKEELLAIENSEAGSFVTKTGTLEAREGNLNHVMQILTGDQLILWDSLIKVLTIILIS